MKKKKVLDFIQYKDMTTWGSTEPEKPYNEIVELERDYLDVIFSDFIDNGSKSRFEKDQHDDITYTIDIEIPSFYNGSDIENYLKSNEEEKEFLLDIKVCIDRTKEEFKTELNMDKSGGYDQIGGSFHKEYYTIIVMNY